MGKGTFSRIFRSEDKKLQAKADELLLKMSKALQSASAKLCQSAKSWVEGEPQVVKEIRDEVVTLERESDKIKEEFIRNIFSKHAYLPQQTQERYQLVLHMDSIIDAAEEASRVIALGYTNEPVEEILGMAQKVWKCTDLVQDAIKYLFTDFEKSMKKAREVDYVREEVRDYKFDLHKKIFRGYIKDPHRAHYLHTVSRRITDVAVKSEITADFIRALVIKYS